MADEVLAVEAGSWVESVVAARAGRAFDWIGVVDELGRSDELRVVVRFAGDGADGVRVETRVPRTDAVLASLREVLPGAAWHEREAADLFGVSFIGGDPRPLLVPAEGPGSLGQPPLLKTAVLGSRVVPWPGDRGGAEEGRRRQAPAGVPDPAVWGARPADAEPPDPSELVGGRRRRR